MKLITTNAKVNRSMEVTPQEARLIQAFRKLCTDTQEFMAEAIQNQAKDQALMRPTKPSLRLLVLGAE